MQREDAPEFARRSKGIWRSLYCTEASVFRSPPPISSAEAHTPTRGHICSVTAVTPRILIMLRNESSLLSSGVIYFCLQLMFRALGIHGHLLLSGCNLAWFWVAHSPPSRLVLCSFHIHFGWSFPPSVSPGLSLPFFSSVVTA